MNGKQDFLAYYERFCKRVAPGNYEATKERLQGDKTLQWLHGVIGLAGEGGESLDALKKFLVYGKKPDPMNILEECGDALWYIVRQLDAYGFTLEECIAYNMSKLSKRYNEGHFTEAQALARKDKDDGD